MNFQRSLVGEGSSAFFTRKRLCACVNALMALQMAGVDEGLWAYFALVRSIAGVHAYMHGKVT